VLLTADETNPLQFRMDALVNPARERLSGETTSVFSGDCAYSFAMVAMRKTATN
jgi:hypothetical protein